MTSKSLVMDMSKEDKLSDDGIWHYKIQHLLNEKDVLQTLDYVVVELEQHALLEEIKRG